MLNWDSVLMRLIAKKQIISQACNFERLIDLRSCNWLKLTLTVIHLFSIIRKSIIQRSLESLTVQYRAYRSLSLCKDTINGNVDKGKLFMKQFAFHLTELNAKQCISKTEFCTLIVAVNWSDKSNWNNLFASESFRYARK